MSLRGALGFASALALACACTTTNVINPDSTASTGIGGHGATTTATTTTSGEGGAGGSGATTSTGGGPCPAGVTCVGTFPFTDDRDTSTGVSKIDAYDCAADTNESGPEIYYRVDVPTDGFLSVAVYDGAGVDVDVHILSDLDPAAPKGTNCLDRGDIEARADVKAGHVWVVADSWANASQAFPGAYKIDIGFIPVVEGACAMETGEMARVGDGGNHLAMPATGPVVMEAHLVTQEEPMPFPMTETDELDAHFALSQAATNLVMHRTQVWAPKEGGGTFFGAGIGDPADFPVADEGWYVNMYWTAAARPPKGTRMILQRGDDLSRAVVVAAGYETGPGDLSSIGGTPEETHYYLGTQHHSVMKLGIATDQSLPLGPRKCK
ncbi:MAG: hypothetical protein U0414_29815 [Polyangiaceae bacterium]